MVIDIFVISSIPSMNQVYIPFILVFFNML